MHFTASAGRYYLKIKSYVDTFNITVDFNGFGFKDSFKDCYENPQNYVPGTEKTGVVSYTDVYDWYKFDIPKSGKYKLSYLANTGEYSFELKNADLKQVWSKSYVNKNELETNEMYLGSGTYYIKIQGKQWSKYKFMISKDDLPCTAIKKIKSTKKGQIKVKFKRVNGIGSYQIMVATDKKFTKNVKTKTFTVKKNSTKKTLEATIKKLKRHKNYYAQIRTCEVANSTSFYSDWSKSKKIRVQ